MILDGKLWIGTANHQPVCLEPRMANRHGLIAGATGTGKTVTLKVMAEDFSALGVPVFISDVKGDLSGMIRPGENTDAIAARLIATDVDQFAFAAFPAEFWDVYGEQGHPVRTTVSEMGPLLLSRMLSLNETQAGVLHILFRVADDEGMLLLDLKDLKAMLAYAGENAERYTLNYGNIARATVGAIQRAVAVLEDQGGDRFFGEPALEITDWLRQDEEGRGVINILACDKLFRNPLMYSTFLLWMLSELYETLPEQGDAEKPRIVFFFDEAHLLFSNCPKALLDKVEQIIRLIRSKGVGVYFVTHNPADVPLNVLGQLSNRVQHALRAFTPMDLKGVKVAAETFRQNPAFDTEEAIVNLATGEALLSFLDEKGAPSVVARALVLPPQSFMGTIDQALRRTFIDTGAFAGVYDTAVDRESAYEYLAATLNLGRQAAPAPAPVYPLPAFVAAPAPVPQAAPTFMVFNPATGGYQAKEIPAMTAQEPAPAPAPGARQSVLALDPATGRYVRKEMTLALDPATGQYLPVMTEGEKQAAAQSQKDRLQAEKAAEAAARRQHMDDLREERAGRARKNDSILGRVQNTAISTATRTVISQLTRGVLGGLIGKR
ncbi:MAG: helicase HerA-like domain-containing protein [Bacillota bacterium]